MASTPMPPFTAHRDVAAGSAYGLRARAFLMCVHGVVIADVTSAVKHFDGRDDVRALVLSGNGKSFSAGASALHHELYK